MKFTNIASVVAILAASTQAANVNLNDGNTGVASTSGTTGSIATGNTVNTANENGGKAVNDANKNNAASVTPAVNNSSEGSQNKGQATVPVVNVDSPIEAKIKKLMGMGAKFGDFNDTMVRGFLTPAEWGRIDYYNNDAPLSEELLRAVMTTTSPAINLTAEEKADKIIKLVPAPQKMGDLSEGVVKGILTAEEWGKIDLRDNNEPINAGLLVEILKSK